MTEENELRLFKIEDLWAGYIDATSHRFDWGKGYTETWDFIGVAECEECGEAVAGVRGEDHHRYLEDDTDCEGYLYCEGPVMNYYYPVDVKRVGGAEEAGKKIVDLPLCVVEFLEDGYPTDDYALALTGGGTDLSWEICEAYTRLGYLPPLKFARVPNYGELSRRTVYVSNALLKSIKVQRARLDRDEEYIMDLARDARLK